MVWSHWDTCMRIAAPTCKKGHLCRPDFVIDSTFDLFCELCATDEQCDFPVVYASGVNGIAGGDPEELADDLAPLFEAIIKEVGSPLLAAPHLHSSQLVCPSRACSQSARSRDSHQDYCHLPRLGGRCESFARGSSVHSSCCHRDDVDLPTALLSGEWDAVQAPHSVRCAGVAASGPQGWATADAGHQPGL